MIKQRIHTYTTTYDIVHCDLCGEEMDYDSPKLRTKDSSNMWPEGGFNTYKGFDCCEKCFLDKIIPILQSADIPIREWEHVV